MELRLARDAQAPVAEHLEEFASRLTRVVLLLSLAAVIWWVFIDTLIGMWVDTLPLGASAGALTIIDPQAWMVTRFSLVGLLAMFTALPLVAFELHRFATPGLLPSERVWFTSLLLIGVSATTAGLMLWWFWGYAAVLSGIASWGSLPGVGARWDAGLLFEIALGLSWWMVFALIELLTLPLARFWSLTDLSPFDMWRVRVHGTLLIGWYIAAPGALDGVWIPMAFLLILIGECGARLIPQAALGGAHRRPTPVFDDEGGVRNALFVMCACEDACPKVAAELAPGHLGWVNADAICLDPEARDRLLDVVIRHDVSDVCISGCDGSPIPHDLAHSLERASVKLWGLEWLDLAPSPQADLVRAATPWKRV